jgi:type IX secretion system PorP/SprF family membrane protein
MKMINKLAVVIIFTITSLQINAQQMPMYTHYMYNTMVVNPAYAGSRDALTVSALHRSQWVGFEGAPSTQTLTLHAPLRNEHIGLGLAVMNDKIGPINFSSVTANFAYIMRVSRNAKLSLGLSAGANMVQANLSSLNIDQQNDPAFANDINNRVNPDFGFGVYYSRERFYAGLSIPNLIENNYSNANDAKGNELAGKNQRHYFFIAGTMLKVSNNLSFKPTTLIKVTAGAPIQADITGSFIIMDKFLLGAMYRTGDATGALIGFDLTNQFHIGYSYDWSVGLSTAKYNQGSHEVMLRYDFMLKNKKQIQTPRYF